jgi:secreted trypsin-like serine protease
MIRMIIASLALLGLIVVPSAQADERAEPGKVRALDATAESRTVDLDWRAPTNTGGRPILDYRVRYRYSPPRHPVTRDARIVGGVDIDNADAPWQVALMFADVADGFNAQFCGGSLIHPQWVLTAAHCVTSDEGVTPAGDLEIGVGITTLSETDPGQRKAVARIIVHPQWNTQTSEHDYALVKLAAPTDAGEPIALWGGRTPPAGTAAFISGWGNVLQQDPDLFAPDEYADVLQGTTINIVGDADCNAAYSGGINGSVMICGGVDGERDTCQGDSGGPLVVARRGAWELAGVTSFGTGCAWPGFPGVYAEVRAVKQWIYGHVPDLGWRARTVDDTSATIGRLTNRARYEFVVQARNRDGFGPGSRITATPRN